MFHFYPYVVDTPLVLLYSGTFNAGYSSSAGRLCSVVRCAHGAARISGIGRQQATRMLSNVQQTNRIDSFAIIAGARYRMR